MYVALHNYEQAYGTLPPLFVCNKQGKPIHSWRALIVPYIEFESLKRLDLSQPWDSQYNRGVANSIAPGEWDRWAGGVGFERLPVSTCILALLGKDSIWDPTTGLPKGTLRRNPDAILLVSVPESDIHPLEPRDITEEEVQALIKGGKEVLFIKASRYTGCEYGIVRMDRGKLVFTDRRSGEE